MGRSKTPQKTSERKEDVKKVFVFGLGKIGQTICAGLAARKDVQLIIGARDVSKAENYVSQNMQDAENQVKCVKISNILTESPSVLASILKSNSPHVVVNAIGPFHSQKPTVLQACILSGVAYLDVIFFFRSVFLI